MVNVRSEQIPYLPKAAATSEKQQAQGFTFVRQKPSRMTRGTLRRNIST